jgi:hypothetical protein
MDVSDDTLALKRRSNLLGCAASYLGETILQGRIAATDGQIDQLVYELYGLTDAEIRVVEEATRA